MGNKEGEKIFGNGKCELIANFSATMVTSPWRERREVWREKRKVRIFGKGKCKLIANCANFWQVKVWIHRQSRDNGDVTSVSLSLSLCLSVSLSLSLSLSLSHRKYLTHNIGSASALPIIQTDGSDVTIVALKLAMSLHFPLPKFAFSFLRSHFPSLPINGHHCGAEIRNEFTLSVAKKIRTVCSDSLKWREPRDEWSTTKTNDQILPSP